MAVPPPSEPARHSQQRDNRREIKRQKDMFGHFTVRWKFLRHFLRENRSVSSENVFPSPTLRSWLDSRIAVLPKLRGMLLQPLPKDVQVTVFYVARQGLPPDEQDPWKQLKKAEIELLRLAILTLEKLSNEFQGEIRLPRWDRALKQIQGELEAVMHQGCG